MYLQITSSSEFPNNIPEFFGLYGVDNLPFFWEPFRSPIFSFFAIWVIPALVAGILGFLVFRNRIKGVMIAKEEWLMLYDRSNIITKCSLSFS